MSKGKLIKVCGECANYDWKKHCCKLGCKEGEPQEPFFSDCPLPTVDTDINVGRKAEWISVGDRLPEMYKTVLCYDGENMIVGFVDSTGDWIHDGIRDGMISGVTHWMPPPELPNAKNERKKCQKTR